MIGDMDVKTQHVYFYVQRESDYAVVKTNMPYETVVFNTWIKIQEFSRLQLREDISSPFLDSLISSQPLEPFI